LNVFGRPFVKRFALCYKTVVWSVFNVGVLWPNGWTDQDETWSAGRPRPWPHCVRWGLRSPPQRGTGPQFLAHICCGQMARWIKMPLDKKVGLYTSDIVLDSDTAPPKNGGRAPLLFPAHVYCAQTAGWIKMPLGMDGLDPSDIVLDWDPVPPPQREQSPPIFGPCLL